jgi:transcription initiation factor TFIIA large subunit
MQNIQSQTLSIYKYVIEQVLEKSQDEFINSGVDDGILHDLKALWLDKLVKSGVLSQQPSSHSINNAVTEHPVKKYESEGNSGKRKGGDDDDGGRYEKRIKSVDDEELGSDLDDSDTDVIISLPSVVVATVSTDLSTTGDTIKKPTIENITGNEERNLLLCQYEKVTRSRNKWKATLKDGVLVVDGKEWMVGRCGCDFEF